MGLSALRPGRIYPPGNNPAIHFCYKLNRPQVNSEEGRFKLIKISRDTIGNRTRKLPASTISIMRNDTMQIRKYVLKIRQTHTWKRHVETLVSEEAQPQHRCKRYGRVKSLVMNTKRAGHKDRPNDWTAVISRLQHQLWNSLNPKVKFTSSDYRLTALNIRDIMTDY